MDNAVSQEGSDEYAAFTRKIEQAGQELTRLQLTNTRPTPLEVWFEPWGYPLTIPANDHLDIIAYGFAERRHGDDPPSLHVGAELVTLWAGLATGGVAVFRNGKLVWQG